MIPAEGRLEGLKARYYIASLPMSNDLLEQYNWCVGHNSCVKSWWFFTRPARFFWDPTRFNNTFYFEKESDRNWFIMRWGYDRN
jgi:hypothetical protein